MAWERRSSNQWASSMVSVGMRAADKAAGKVAEGKPAAGTAESKPARYSAHNSRQWAGTEPLGMLPSRHMPAVFDLYKARV
ncbi:MAG: hypothetical protein RSE58_03060 [Clostridia bacterium]